MPEAVELYTRIGAFVRAEMAKYDPGHDWSHIERVTSLAERIRKIEGGDELIVRLAALLHDIDDWKFKPAGHEDGPEKARAIMLALGVPENVVRIVCDIIHLMGFKGGHQQRFKHVEGRIVQDADRLDALGAIGIGRAFSYGGYKNRPMHDPSMPPKLQMTEEEYRNNKGTTINHFHEKLLVLGMNTKTGELIAEQRRRYMRDFLVVFNAEWNGVDYVVEEIS